MFINHDFEWLDFVILKSCLMEVKLILGVPTFLLLFGFPNGLYFVHYVFACSATWIISWLFPSRLLTSVAQLATKNFFSYASPSNVLV